MRQIVMASVGALLVCSVAGAATYPISSYPNLHGVIVRGICQDERGHLWLTTDDNIWRWEGKAFEPLAERIGAGPPAYCAREGAAGVLWVGTHDGVIGLDPQTLRVRFRPPELNGLRINCLERDPEGAMWVGTVRGLYRLEMRGNMPRVAQVEGAEDVEILCIAPGAGEVLAGTRGSLLCVRAGSVTRLHREVIDGGRTRAVLRAADASLWVGLRRGDGLYRIVNGAARRFTEADGLLNDEVNVLVEYGGEIWVGTEDGIYRWTGSRFEAVDRRLGLENTDVHSMLVDREGQLWVGTYGGGVFQLRSPHFLHHGIDDGLRHPVVTSLAADQTGKLIAGTIKGATIFDPDTGSMTTLGPGFHVEAVYVSPAGDTWLGGPEGFCRAGDEKINKSLRGVRAIGADGEGRVLIGTTGGLWVLEEGDVRRVGLSRERRLRVNDLVLAGQKQFYAATDAGLFRREGKDWRLVLPGHRIDAACRKGDGGLWLATQRGLLACDAAGGLEGASDSAIEVYDVCSLVVDEEGVLWVATREGVVRAHRRRQERLTVVDGLSSRDVRCVLAYGGRLYAGTTRGLTAINIPRLRPCMTRPLVIIERLIAGGDIWTPGRGGLTLAYAEHDVLMQVRTLGWRSARGMRYRFKLEGYDTQWSALTEHGLGYYNHLPPGRYRFCVQGVNDRGLESAEVSAVAFSILPPFWKEPWFIALSALAAVGLGAAAYRVRTRRSSFLAERRRGREALRRSEEQYRMLVETMNEGVGLMDKSDILIFANDRLCEMLGYTREELVGRPANSYFYDERNRVMIEEQLAQRRRINDEPYEALLRRKDGRKVAVFVSPRVVLDAEGDFNGSFAVVTDISAYRRTQRERDRLFALSFDMICIAGLDGYFKRINPAFERTLGYTKEELLAKPFVEFVHPQDRAVTLDEMDKLASGATTIYFENRYRCKDGSYRWLAWTFVPDVERRLIYAVARDMTERKAAEEALRESEERFRAVINASKDAMVAINSAGRVIIFNPAAERIFGRTRAEMLGRPADCLMPEEYRERHARRVKAFFATGESQGVIGGTREFPAQRRDGRTFPTELSLSVTQLGSGRIVLAVIRDITERKRAEEAIRASEEKYRSLFDTSRDGIDFTDLTGRIEDANQAFVDMLGYSLEEIRTMTYQQLTPGKWAAKEEKIIAEQVMKRGYSDEYEKEYIRKDGTTLPVMVRVWLVSDEHGRPLRMLGLFRDITERKQAEEVARRRHAELAHVSRLSTVGEMAARLAHELNQPLSAISNYANGCLRRIRTGAPRTSELVHALEQMAEQADRAGQVMRRVRGFVRKESPRRSDMDLNQVIREAAQFVAMDARRNRVRLSLDLAEELPLLRADAIQVEQVILNLLLNGIEAMEGFDGEARDLIVRTSATDGGTVTVSVRDRGSGVDAARLERVFEPFYTTKPRGMGMGLSISRSIIDQHGGRLWASANDDGGATFQFTLPVGSGVARDAT